MESLTSQDRKALYMKKYRRNPVNQYKQKMYEINYWKRKYNAATRELEAMKGVRSNETNN